MTASFWYLHLNKRTKWLTPAKALSDISVGASGVTLTSFCALDWFLMVFSAWKPLKFPIKTTPLRDALVNTLTKEKHTESFMHAVMRIPVCDRVWIYEAARATFCAKTCTENEIFIEVHGRPVILQSEFIQAFNVHVIFIKGWTLVT